jgi:hypothetical protein
MSETLPVLFAEVNNGTVFVATQFWRDEDTRLLNFAPGAWEWEQAAAVIGPVEPKQFEDLEGPQCMVLWMGQHLHIRAKHEDVLRAWLRYKTRFGGQYIRLQAN